MDISNNEKKYLDLMLSFMSILLNRAKDTDIGEVLDSISPKDKEAIRQGFEYLMSLIESGENNEAINE